MLTVHHLAFSRSLRVLWILEELGVDYELVSYSRTAEFKALPELAKIHSLGKAPVIVDGDLTLAESASTSMLRRSTLTGIAPVLASR